jgi:hypothetical protein
VADCLAELGSKFPEQSGGRTRHERREELQVNVASVISQKLHTNAASQLSYPALIIWMRPRARRITTRHRSVEVERPDTD